MKRYWLLLKIIYAIISQRCYAGKKKNHASKQTLAPVRHALSVYKGSALSLVAGSLGYTSPPCLFDTPPAASSTLPPAVEEEEEEVVDHPSEFPAPKAPLVEGTAQGGSAAAPLAVGALVAVALGAHQVVMEGLEEAVLVAAMEEAALVVAMEEAAMEEAALEVAASVVAASVEVAMEEALVVDSEEMVVDFSLEMRR